MDKFKPAIKPLPSIKYLKRRFGVKKPDAIKMIEDLKSDEVWLNDIYEVELTYHLMDGWPDMVHLSIKRRDKESIHDWRDLQQIKNEIVGKECEGVELYPAESRVLDAANQYHLWCFADTKSRFPFGFTTGGKPCRATPEMAAMAGAKQREF